MAAATVTQMFIPGPRLIDGSDLNTLVAQINTALAGGNQYTSLTVTPGATSVAALTASGVVSLTNASVSMSALPTADPHVAGRLWANSGVLTVSAG